MLIENRKSSTNHWEKITCRFEPKNHISEKRSNIIDYILCSPGRCWTSWESFVDLQYRLCLWGEILLCECLSFQLMNNCSCRTQINTFLLCILVTAFHWLWPDRDLEAPLESISESTAWFVVHFWGGTLLPHAPIKVN